MTVERRAREGAPPLIAKLHSTETLAWYRHLNQALNALSRLHILHPVAANGNVEDSDSKELQLNSRFRHNFKLALTGG